MARRCRGLGSTTGGCWCDSLRALHVASARPTGFHVEGWRVCLGRRQATGVAGTLGGRPGDSICLCCCPSARRAVDDQLCVGRAARPSRRLDGRGKAADPSAVPGGRPVSRAGRPLRGGFARQVGRGRCGAPSRDSSPPHPFPSGDAWPPHGGPSRGLFRWLPRPLRRGGRAPPRGVPSPRPGESGTTSASPAPPPSPPFSSPFRHGRGAPAPPPAPSVGRAHPANVRDWHGTRGGGGGVGVEGMVPLRMARQRQPSCAADSSQHTGPGCDVSGHAPVY